MSSGDSAREQPRDVVALAVMTNRMEGVVRKMTNTLFRTARSTVLNTARDFSCCIVTANHEMLVMAESLPIHVISGPDVISRWLRHFHPQPRRGQAFIHNSPYHGNSHAGDHCIVVPVIDDEGRQRATAIVKAHMADIGNSEPTTLMATARDVYEEGALIFPCVKIQENYEDVEDVVRMCMSRIRVPEDWYGDYIGMIGAARVGERELLKVGEEVGWDAFDRYVADWLDYSEERMRATIRELPAGTRTGYDIHDAVPLRGVEDGVPLKVTVAVDPESEEIEIDLRDNPDCLPCGLNLTESTAVTSSLIGVFNSIAEPVPRNTGSGRAVKVLLRENCVVGIPVHPASCSMATSGIAERLAGIVQRTLAEFADGLGMASTGPECPPAVAGLSGRDPRHENAPFVDMMILGNSGGAGHPHGDGWVTNGETSDGGSMMRDSTEVLELLRPIRVWSDRIVPDTEGAGRFRGAPSLYIEYGPVDTELEVLYAADGTVNPALGVRGGQSGALCRPAMRKADGEIVALEAWARVVLQPGETIISISSGGGGYGPPHERAVEHVLHDVADGWVSVERTREVYGVVLGEDGSVDAEATRVRRAELAATAHDSPAAGAEAAAEARAVHGRDDDAVLGLLSPGPQA
ncbi:MAG TPA: hydantoinase B/oxoprolinase family protein [Solirubrobacteraceae bacterium]|jgi:N-methylhydantoinase B|nr:hydantoinase B/oxoprolinase family protein [Solirubrobacteraceae bacterium]